MDNFDNNSSKLFDLGSVLSVTTGRMLTNMNDILDVVSFVIGKKVMLHELSTMSIVAYAHILCLHPELCGVGTNVNINGFEDAMAFIADAKKSYGDELELTPIPVMAREQALAYVDPSSIAENNSNSNEISPLDDNNSRLRIIPIEKSHRFRTNKNQFILLWFINLILEQICSFLFILFNFMI